MQQKTAQTRQRVLQVKSGVARNKQGLRPAGSPRATAHHDTLEAQSELARERSARIASEAAAADAAAAVTALTGKLAQLREAATSSTPQHSATHTGSDYAPGVPGMPGAMNGTPIGAGAPATPGPDPATQEYITELERRLAGKDALVHTLYSKLQGGDAVSSTLYSKLQGGGAVSGAAGSVSAGRASAGVHDSGAINNGINSAAASDSAPRPRQSFSAATLASWRQSTPEYTSAAAPAPISRVATGVPGAPLPPGNIINSNTINTPSEAPASAPLAQTPGAEHSLPLTPLTAGAVPSVAAAGDRAATSASAPGPGASAWAAYSARRSQPGRSPPPSRTMWTTTPISTAAAAATAPAANGGHSDGLPTAVPYQAPSAAQLPAGGVDAACSAPVLRATASLHGLQTSQATAFAYTTPGTPGSAPLQERGSSEPHAARKGATCDAQPGAGGPWSVPEGRAGAGPKGVEADSGPGAVHMSAEDAEALRQLRRNIRQLSAQISPASPSRKRSAPDVAIAGGA